MKRIFTLTIALILSINLAVFPVSAETSAKPSSSEVLNQIVVLPKSDYNKTTADKMISRLAVIPAPLLQGLKDNSVKIKLVNGKITDEPEFTQYKGVIPRGWENTGLTWDDVPGVSSNVVIARIGYSNKGKGHNGQNLELHETFHAIDRLVLNNVSSSAAFLNVWKKEADIKYKNDGYVSVYSTEYFAETATLYFFSEETRSELKDDMPLTYDFLNNLFSNL